MPRASGASCTTATDSGSFAAAGGDGGGVDAALPGTVPQWPTTWAAAVSAGGGPDVGSRHHGHGEPRPWFAVHAGRLFCSDLRSLDREFRGGRGACAWRHTAARHG